MNTRCLLAVVLTFLGTPVWGAQSVSLDGEWMLCRSDSAELPGAQAAWEPVKVPHLVEQASHKPFLWYRRAVEVPARMAGRHVFLRFEAVRFVSEVYWNGRKVGGHFGGWEPFEIDVTEAGRPGASNELVVRVQDVTGVIDQEMDYVKKPGQRRFVDQAQDSIMAPVGSQFSRVGIWQPVSLLARPDVYVDDVFVQTSVRKKRLSAQVVLKNLSGQTRRVTLAAAVEGGGPELGAPTVDVPASGAAKLTLGAEWADARLWGPEDPHLYHLRTSVADGGREIDAARTRFGFREFWTAGPELVLNGTPMKFLATAGHPRGDLDDGLSKADAVDFFRRIREAGCVAMRLHANVWPMWWYDAADESGVPLIMESALFCWAQSYALSKPEFWKNYHEHLRAILRAHQNHPSIVMFSLENEILHCGGGRRVPETEHRLAEAGRLVKSLDPTRPILYDGDGDPEGVADVVNYHYPLDFKTRNLWPEAGYWLETGMELACHPRTFYQWDRKKPLYFGEFLHIQHYTEAEPYSTLAGDEAFLGHDRAMALAKAAAWEMQIEAYRDAGVSGLCPWTLTETGPFPSDDNPRYLAVKRAYEKNGAYVREYDNRFFAGEEVARTVSLYNDTLHRAELVCSWRLLRGEEVVDSGEHAARLEPATKDKFQIRLHMPECSHCTPLALALEVRSGERVVFQRSKPYWVYPKKTLDLPQSLRLAFFGKGDGAVGRLLAASGVKPVPVKDLAYLPEAEVLLVGAHALDGIKPEGGLAIVGDRSGTRQVLETFVRRGGAVIVLEQDSYDCGLLPARLVERGCTIAFTRTRDPILTAGLLGGDFQFWRGDQVVARKTILKPTEGRFRALVDSGGPQGLVYLPLLEVPSGRGRYLLSQLLIEEKLDEPAAQRTLENLIRYAAQPGPAPKPIGLVAAGPVLAECLDELDARYEDLSGKLAGADLGRLAGLLVDPECAEVRESVKKIRQYVEQGGRVVLHGATRQAVETLRPLFPVPLVSQRSSAGPLAIAQPDPLTDGLTNQELYWYRPRMGLSYRDRTPLVHDVSTWTILPGMPDERQCTTVEARAMEVAYGKPSRSKGGVGMYASSAIQKKIDFPQSGEYAFGIRGRGTPLAGVYPQITLAINGQPAGSIQMESGQWAMYGLSAAVEKGEHEVRLAFTNDASDPATGEDRNAELERLVYGPLPPAKFERLVRPAALVKVPCGSGFYLMDQVNWDRDRCSGEKPARYLSNLLTNLGCDFHSPISGIVLAGEQFASDRPAQKTQARDGSLYVGSNGTVWATVRFASGGRWELALRAQGTDVDGEFPHVDVLVDSRKLGTLRLVRPGWQVLRLSAEIPAGEHKIGLRFTNDLYRPPADRNLTIGWLRVRED